MRRAREVALAIAHGMVRPCPVPMCTTCETPMDLIPPTSVVTNQDGGRELGTYNCGAQAERRAPMM